MIQTQFIEATGSIGFDSGNLKPDLGNWMKVAGVRVWLNKDKERRLSPNSIEQAVLQVQEEYEIRSELDPSSVRESFFNLCKYALNDIRKNPKGTFYNLLENLRFVAVAGVLDNKEYVTILQKHGFNTEVMDNLVTKTVLYNFFGVLSTNFEQRNQKRGNNAVNRLN